ncbi:PAS domain-containing protein [Azospirillum sp. CT11-132]|uniref:PAS domain-containing protein n=1 Tax=Azospirillum sp. CT11-132 TaxID=3396317 RepID=UPI0039A5E9AD
METSRFSDHSLSIQEQHRLGHALLHAAADAIVYSDRNGVIRFWNAGAERIFGFSAAEALGQSLDIIIPERQRDRHWEGYDRVIASGQTHYGKGDLLSVPALHKDGHRISTEFTIIPVYNDQGIMVGMASVMRDVTARFEEMKALRRQLVGR